jgi:hypothetical protein
MARRVAAAIIRFIGRDLQPADDVQDTRIGETRFVELIGANSAIEDHHSGGVEHIHLRRRDPGGHVGSGAMAMRHGAAVDPDRRDISGY